jgi:GntR family hexuronate regulon transcriptional repressor
MQAGVPTTKLYQQIARAIAAAIADGRYARGDRLPSERELAEYFSVSRPTIRDAMIALEFQGLVEARPGSGVYVAAPAANETDEPGVSPLAIAEAQRLFEGEACALAAVCMTDDQLASLDVVLQEMSQAEDTEKLERDFHLMIARGSRNAAIVSGIEDLWAMRPRMSSPSEHWVNEHRQILAALRARDSKAARLALHAHFNRVIEGLLDLAEADAVERTRQKMAEQRRALALRNDL